MAKNKTFWKCSKCGRTWITERISFLSNLSPEYYNKSTKEKPFIKKCRKCFKKDEWENACKGV